MSPPAQHRFVAILAVAAAVLLLGVATYREFQDRAVLASRMQSTPIRATNPATQPATTEETPFELPDGVAWAWTGAVTTESVTIKARVSKDAKVRVSLHVEGGNDEVKKTEWMQARWDRNRCIVSAHFDGLAPAHRYLYKVETDSVFDAVVEGRFWTLPTAPATFSFALGSCMRTGTKHEVFNTIRRHQPLFFLQVGDFHYRNIEVNDPQRFIDAFDRQLTEGPLANLLREVAIAYIWDDHDYGPDNSDKKSPSRNAARFAYRLAVPHFPLAAEGGQSAIYQAFTVGRVRFILTDLRSERGDGSMMGAAQKEWFLKELDHASRTHAAVFWVSTVPWIDSRERSTDSWAGFREERREIANFIQEKGIRNLAILSGDAHMLAIDDGTNSDFSDHKGLRIPVFQAGALDQKESLKGGPYSHGAKPGLGQYGWVEVIDSGTSVTIRFSGRNHLDEELMKLEFSFPE